MSTMQRLTLIGFVNYDPSLFDNLVLPEGYDKDTFIDSLLLEHGEKCMLYSNPAFMKNAIGAWSRKWSLELSRICDALTAEYNPIYNYDRFEEYTDTENRGYKSNTSSGHTATDSPNYSDTQTNNYSVVQDTNENETLEHTTSAYNSDGYSPDWKETKNGGKTTTSNSGTIKHDISGKTQDLSERANSSTTDTENRDLTHSAHLYGNIGVTTSATMVSEVVRQRFQYNLYETATRLFANELLIGIY